MNMPNLSGAVRAINPFTRALLGFLILTIGFQWFTLEYSASSSVTVDEFAHLPAGVATWETGTFQSYRENPPLVRGLLALPAWLAGAKMDYTSARAGLGERSEWQVGTDFMHANKANYLELYRGARFVNLLIATGCGLLIQAEPDFYWAISSNLLHGFSGSMPMADDDEPFHGVVASRHLTPERAVARVGSIFVFKVVSSANRAGRATPASDLKGCIRKAGFSDLYVTP